MLESPKVQFLVLCCFWSTSNDLSSGLSSNPMLFTDDTSLFSVVHDGNISANKLNNTLLKVRSQAYQWKISFNPDPSKQVQEVIFSRKIKNPNYPIPVNQTPYQKHLGSELNFVECLTYVSNKVNKSIRLSRKIDMILRRRLLVTIYKPFNRPHFDFFIIIIFVIKISIRPHRIFSIKTLISQTVHFLQDI